MNELLRKILFLPPQASTVAREIDHLHFFVILTTMGGAVLITLVGGYFLVRYRRRSGDDLRPVKATTPPPPALEAAVIASLLGLFLVFWFIGQGQYAHLRVAPEDSLDVYVTGKQWMWKFSYPSGAHSIGTLYVPAGKPVRLWMTSRDVIHSFFVPDFRVKEDVIPGRTTTVWFEAPEPGAHQIFCSQYCGSGHSTMLGTVVVLSAAEYERWLAGESGGERRGSDLVAAGEHAAAQHGCFRCHTSDGTPHIGPSWGGLYASKVVLEDGSTVRADEAYITESMMDPVAKRHRGYPLVMPSYLGLIQPGETAAIIEYIKSLRDVAPTTENREPSPDGGAP